MKLEWLEKLEKNGAISRAAFNRIEKEVASHAHDMRTIGHELRGFTDKVPKMIEDTVDLSLIKKFQSSAPSMADKLLRYLPLVTPVLAVGGYMAAQSKMDKDRRQLLQTIANNKAFIAGNYTGKNKIKAEARFDEISKIAPNVAANQTLATKIVSENLHSGIDSATAQKLSLIQAVKTPHTKLGSHVRPEVLGNIVADMYILKEAASKKTFMGRAGKFLWDYGRLASIPLAVNAIGGAVSWGASQIKKKNVTEALSKSYYEALQGNTANAEVLKSNPEAAQKAFKTLSHFAPSIAMNPDAARGFMAKIVEYGQGGVEATDLKALTDIQKNMVHVTPKHPFLQGFESTSDTGGMTSLLHSGAKGAHAELIHDMVNDPEAGLGRSYLGKK